MNTFEIRAHLGITPSNLGVPNMLQIVRGATASLTFDLSDKVYTFDETDQVTFMLKQGKTIYWYKMFTYLQPTKDRLMIPGKNYYTNLQVTGNSYKCTSATLVTEYAGNPSNLGYYEEADGNCSWRDTYYMLDERFARETLGEQEQISLVLLPEDTLQFTTKAGKPIIFEVAVRLNTEKLPGFASRDAIIIEPQVNIRVVDSLFSQI